MNGKLNSALLAILLTGCTTPHNEADTTPDENPSSNHVVTDSTSSSNLSNPYQVFALPMPGELDFAGEPVPMERTDVRESLDRELHVNTYWHSQTFLFFKRANRWFPLIEKILEDNEIPQDFKYLCLIESGLDNVVSPSGASGFWQFMKSTGQDYGLEINSNIDERYHVVKATKAACNYLKNAYEKLGSWTLAAASYNMGKAGVQNSLESQLTNSYYDLELNSETARYVYRILAVKQIITHPNDYGFHFKAEELYPQFQTQTILIDSTINNLAEFAIENGTTYKLIKLLNPWLRQDNLQVSDGREYEVLIPADGFNDPATTVLKEYGNPE